MFPVLSLMIKYKSIENKICVTKCLNLTVFKQDLAKSSFKVVLDNLSLADSDYFLVCLCPPCNKPQVTFCVNLFSGASSFVLSLLQWLQSVTLKVGIDGDIISFLKNCHRC